MDEKGGNMDYKLTPEVCAQLGMTPAALNSWLSRHERFKPKLRNPNGAMLWSDAEIAAVQQARATPPPSTEFKHDDDELERLRQVLQKAVQAKKAALLAGLPTDAHDKAVAAATEAYRQRRRWVVEQQGK